MYSRRGKGDERQNKNKKNRFSSEYTMLSILEYPYTNTQKIPVSKYNIMTNTPGIRRQRPDRVNLMIDSLEKNGYIASINISSNLTFYNITQNGISAYEKWIKDFLEFARNTNIVTAIDTHPRIIDNESLKRTTITAVVITLL
jgi:DNA-binding PadR family transcriptional regulator